MGRRTEKLTGYNALVDAVSENKKGNLLYSSKNSRLTSGDGRIIDKYLRMNKVLVGRSGAITLSEMAERLDKSTSNAAHLHYARGWMLAEASLAGVQAFSASERTEMLEQSGVAFQTALEIGVSKRSEKGYHSDRNYRLALAMAHIPLMQAMVDNDVTVEIERIVTADVIEITKSAYKHHEHLSGLINELSIFTLLHLMEDPKYVALPSTYRGDIGIYNKNQTHDIVSIKQHFGEIRQIQPIEVKTHVSDEIRARYWPTLVSSEDTVGSLLNKVSRGRFITAAEAVLDGGATDRQADKIATAQLCLVATLKKYAETGRPVGSPKRTPTRFYGRNQFVAA